MSKKREQVKNAIKKVMLKCGWKSVEDFTKAVMDVIEPKYPRVFRDVNSKNLCVFDGPGSEAKTYHGAGGLLSLQCKGYLKWHEESYEVEELFGTDREEALKTIEEANNDVEVTVEGKTTRISRKSALALNLIKE